LSTREISEEGKNEQNIFLENDGSAESRGMEFGNG
jgi:hypothetical protein